MAQVEPEGFIRDAVVLLQLAIRHIDEKMKSEQIVEAATFLAFGLERVLKEVLWRINPLYVLEDPSFKNSLPVLYRSKMLATELNDPQIASKPNSDVLTFRNSLVRAAICSPTILKHKALLFKVSELRDILAHHQLRNIDFGDLEILLQRDTYPLLCGLCDELELKRNVLFRGHNIRLAKMSARLEKDIAKSLERLFEGHLAIWKSLRGNPGFVEDKEKVTAMILSTDFKVPFDCPACGNMAVLYGSPEFELNVQEAREVLVSVSVRKLKCQYCKLEIRGYEQIDFLNLNAIFATYVRDRLDSSPG